jgi:hypothetical protein
MKIEVSAIQISYYGIQRYADHDDGRRISAARLSDEISRMVGGWGGGGGGSCHRRCNSNKNTEKRAFAIARVWLRCAPPAIVKVWLRCAPPCNGEGLIALLPLDCLHHHKRGRGLGVNDVNELSIKASN